MPATATDRIDGLTTSVAVKAPVRVASSLNLTLAGQQTVNGVSVVEGDRVLVKDQATQSENGIYVVSTGNWTRALDFDGNRDVVQGSLVVVNENSDFYYRVTASNPVTIGTTAITFEVVSGSVTRSAIGLVLYPALSGETNIIDRGYIYGHVRRYGVTLNGLTDDTTALQNCITNCQTLGIPIVGDAGTAKVTSTITIGALIGDLSALTVSAASASVKPVIRVGVNTGGPTTINGRLRLPKVLNSSYVVGSHWAGFGTGIDLANLYQSDILIPQVTGFDIGVDAGGYDEGFVHNTVTIVMLQNNKRGLRIGGKAGTGWANQNVFNVQRCFIASAEGAAISGVRHVLFAPFNVANNDVSWPNGNTLIGASVEGDAPEYQVEFAGNNNLLLNARFESTNKAIKFTGHASVTKTYENFIVGGYDSAGIVVTTSGVVIANGVINPRKTSLSSDDVVMNLQNVGGSGLPAIQGFDASAGQTIGKTSAATDYNFQLAANGLKGKARTDTNNRVEIDFVNGVMKLGSGASAALQVVGPRDTGWSAMTGTPNEVTVYDTATVTLAQLAGRVKALQDALTTHGLLGT